MIKHCNFLIENIQNYFSSFLIKSNKVKNKQWIHQPLR